MIDFIEKKPSAQEYSSLTEAVGWGREPDSIVEEMFENTLYSVCAYDGELDRYAFDPSKTKRS